MHTFKQTKHRFKDAFNTIITESDSDLIDEAALPAYAHKNILIDFLFWKRIQLAYQYAQKNSTPKNILDFGCGSGVLSHLLAQEGHSVTACDIEFSPLKLVQDKIEFPSNITFIEGDIISGTLKHQQFDIIYALDVLEHIDNLDDYIHLFSDLLSPEGVIIVSGPTENIFYKIGRQFAGNKFTGDYHVSNISHIKTAFQKFLNVSTLKTLYPPVKLFELFIAQKH
ncbi:MAG: class I SAM-dependent methyltransferase [Flavobacteriaceae bacterium]